MRYELLFTFALSGLLAVGAGCSTNPDDNDDSESPVDEFDAGNDGGTIDAGTDTEPDEMDVEIGPDDEDKDTETDTIAPDTERPDANNMGFDTGDISSDGGTDSGLDCVEGEDDDSDGLTNCDEIQMCTDPNNGDTDNDGLGDLEEIQNQTDPCKADTDNDGVNDRTEIQLGLDPNRASSYGTPQKVDSERWFVDHCDTANPEPVEYYEDYDGNWTIALPPTFEYTPLDIQKPNQKSLYHAASVYDDPTLEVAGALLSRDAPSSQTSPLDPLDVDNGDIHDTIEGMADIEDNLVGAEFTTHNEKPAASNEYILTLPQDASPRRLRDDILLALGAFERPDIQPPGLPNSAGAQYSQYRVSVSVTYRRHLSGETTNLIAIGLAPLEQYNSRDKVEFRLDDLTNTTNIADAKDAHKSTCVLQKPPNQKPKAEFYWVLDQSGSMDDENAIISNFSSQFEGKLQNTQLDYRLGVTNMDPDNSGHLYLGPGWHTNSDTFSSEIRKRVITCTGSNWGCSNGTEHGLEATTKGLRFMKGLASNLPTPAEETRSDADIYSIFMSDEAAQGSWDENFLASNTTAFALTAQSEQLASGNPDCDIGFPEPEGNYRNIALQSGGQWADLCSGPDRLTQFLEEMIKAANRDSSPFEVGETPISVSLRLFLNDNGGGNRWVPRSTESGFDYSPSSNTVAFFGDYRPQFDPPRGTQPDWIGMNFETYTLRCKDVLRRDDVNTCGLPSDNNQ